MSVGDVNDVNAHLLAYAITLASVHVLAQRLLELRVVAAARRLLPDAGASERQGTGALPSVVCCCVRVRALRSPSARASDGARQVTRELRPGELSEPSCRLDETI